METAKVSRRYARVRGWAGLEMGVSFLFLFSRLAGSEAFVFFLFPFPQLLSLWRGVIFRYARLDSDRLKFAAGQVREAGNNLDGS